MSEQATPRPWSELAHGNSYLADGTLVPDSLLIGPRGTYNREWVGWGKPPSPAVLEQARALLRDLSPKEEGL